MRDAVIVENGNAKATIEEEKANNGLPSYTEAVGALEEKESNETADLDSNSAVNDLLNEENELDNENKDKKEGEINGVEPAISSQETDTTESSEMEEEMKKEPNSSVGESDEVAKEEKKFRFRFQLFTEKK